MHFAACLVSGFNVRGNFCIPPPHTGLHPLTHTHTHTQGIDVAHISWHYFLEDCLYQSVEVFRPVSKHFNWEMFLARQKLLANLLLLNFKNKTSVEYQVLLSLQTR